MAFYKSPQTILCPQMPIADNLRPRSLVFLESVTVAEERVIYAVWQMGVVKGPNRIHFLGGLNPQLS